MSELYFVISRDGQRAAAMPRTKAISAHLFAGRFSFANQAADGAVYPILSADDGLAWVLRERETANEQKRLDLERRIRGVAIAASPASAEAA